MKNEKMEYVSINYEKYIDNAFDNAIRIAYEVLKETDDMAKKLTLIIFEHILDCYTGVIYDQ